MKTERIDLIALSLVYDSDHIGDIAFFIRKNLLGAMTKEEKDKIDSLADQFYRELAPILIRSFETHSRNKRKSSMRLRRKRSTN